MEKKVIGLNHLGRKQNSCPTCTRTNPARRRRKHFWIRSISWLPQRLCRTLVARRTSCFSPMEKKENWFKTILDPRRTLVQLVLVPIRLKEKKTFLDSFNFVVTPATTSCPRSTEKQLFFCDRKERKSVKNHLGPKENSCPTCTRANPDWRRRKHSWVRSISKLPQRLRRAQQPFFDRTSIYDRDKVLRINKMFGMH